MYRRITASRKDLGWLDGQRIRPDFNKATPVGHELPKLESHVARPHADVLPPRIEIRKYP